MTSDHITKFFEMAWYLNFKGYNIYQSVFLLFVILNWWKPSCCVYELKILQQKLTTLDNHLVVAFFYFLWQNYER